MILDKFHDECGLMAVWNHPEAANLTYLGLYAQQHRGQEGAGVLQCDRSAPPGPGGVERPLVQLGRSKWRLKSCFKSRRAAENLPPAQGQRAVPR